MAMLMADTKKMMGQIIARNIIPPFLTLSIAINN